MSAFQTISIPQQLATLRETFQHGQTQQLHWQRAQLQALRAFLVEREAAIAEALRADLRKSSAESFLYENKVVQGEIRYALRHLTAWATPRRPKVPLLYQPAKAQVVREPYGVALIMGAWNYPLQLCLAPLVSALAAGNCAIIKPSEHAPHTSALLAQELYRYLDAEAVMVIEGAVDVAKALLAERFDVIFYTGSYTVGREVMAAAAHHVTPLTLELGGKCPCLVEQTSNYHVVARRIVWAKFLNAGQTCLAPDYVLVHEHEEAALLQALAAAIHHLYGNNPSQSPNYSRIINRHHTERLAALLADGTIYTGGQAAIDDCYLAPTILSKVHPESALLREEIFGPILPIITYRTLDEALAIMRTHGEPLAVYLFSDNRQVQAEVVRRSRSGGVCINDVLMHAALHTMPFGGLGSSGFGAYHGKAGFDAFSYERSILHRSLHPDPTLRYPPYHGWRYKLLRWATEHLGG